MVRTAQISAAHPGAEKWSPKQYSQEAIFHWTAFTPLKVRKYGTITCAPRALKWWGFTNFFFILARMVNLQFFLCSPPLNSAWRNFIWKVCICIFAIVDWQIAYFFVIGTKLRNNFWGFFVGKKCEWWLKTFAKFCRMKIIYRGCEICVTPLKQMWTLPISICPQFNLLHNFSDGLQYQLSPSGLAKGDISMIKVQETYTGSIFIYQFSTRPPPGKHLPGPLP